MRYPELHLSRWTSKRKERKMVSMTTPLVESTEIHMKLETKNHSRYKKLPSEHSNKAGSYTQGFLLIYLIIS